MMTEQSHEREWELFNRALEIQPEDKRRAFLDQECGCQSDTRAHIERLLSAHQRAKSFLEQPAFVGEPDLDPTTIDQATSDSLIGQQFGRYRITSRLARGGMGVVYAAEQESPQRKVALKLVRFGFDDESVRRRFQYEVEALGRLRHPGIAQIYEAGTTPLPASFGGDLVPFFAMEFVNDALPITEYAKGKHLSMRERLELFATVCDAVHHGHQNGIIHRDLKPANILVDSSGQPKIIDFGVARATDIDRQTITRATEIGQLVGTLQYMSPEQCSGGPIDVDTRSDVYSLGVVLYELLSGKLPYDVRETAIHEASRIIREQPPTAIRTIDKALRGDVETIVNKALEKEPERRYASASELGADVRRLLAGDSITARPASASYQARILLRRHKLGVTIAVTFALLLVVTAALTAISAYRIDAERWATEREAAKLSAINDFLRSLFTSIRPRSARGEQLTVEHLMDSASSILSVTPPVEPEVELELRSLIGYTFSTLSRLHDAERHLARAVELHGALHGNDSVETQIARAKLADVLRMQGRLQEAEESIRDVCDILDQTLPKDHKDLIDAKAELILILADGGKFSEAAPLAQGVYNARCELYGPESEPALISLNALAGILDRLGRDDEAVQMYQDGLRVCESGSTDLSWITAMFKANLGILLIEQGNASEGRDLLAESVDITKHIHGLHSVELIEISSLYTSALLASGDVTGAERRLRDLIPLAAEVHGADSAFRYRLEYKLGALLQDNERHEEAEAHLVRSLAGLRATIGPGADTTIGVAMRVAQVRHDLGSADEARNILLETYKTAKESLTESHPATITCGLNLAAAFLESHDLAQAIAWAEKSYHLAKSSFGETHALAQNSLTILVQSLEEAGETEKADTYRRLFTGLSDTDGH